MVDIPKDLYFYLIDHQFPMGKKLGKDQRDPNLPSSLSSLSSSAAVLSLFLTSSIMLPWIP
jgi:hypothetical protein